MYITGKVIYWMGVLEDDFLGGRSKRESSGATAWGNQHILKQSS
ncbi:hypothetical protein LAL4801_01138 [Roseibium aggregatum]|uniref:Uncharacterized protein n=1 Tax=Roseibium aggregatum TaxID=187304 RepID=A0A0M6XZH0_9HYPH|nr:hypothetical protein LAL4801_01138 [Roseibium aggregatum]